MKHARFAALALAGAALVTVAACSSSTGGAPPSATAQRPSLAPLSLPALPTAPAAPATPSTSAPAAVTLPDACSLLTRTEAETVAGVKLDAGQDTKARDPMTDTASCTYNAPVTGSSGSVSVFAQMGPEYGLGVDKSIGHKFHSVPGIADGAVEEPNNIFFHAADLWVQISSAYSAMPAHLEAAAQKIAARLSTTSS